jgi:hypothetical protein
MRIVYPSHDKQAGLDESSLRGEEYMDGVLPMLEEDTRTQGCEAAFPDDEDTGDILSLLEENARLRGLVVKLSNIIQKSIVDQS